MKLIKKILKKFRTAIIETIPGREDIVLDTSLLSRTGSLDMLIEQDQNIIILDEVIKELDKHKRKNNYFGKNVRQLLKLIAHDETGKFKVVVADTISQYTDVNIIDFCKSKGDEVILYTSDNAMAAMAKGYGIKYRIIEDRSEKLVDVAEEKTESSNQPSLNKIIPITESPVHTPKKRTLKNTNMIGGRLYLSIPKDTYKINYIVLDKYDKIKPVNPGKDTLLEVDDVVFILLTKGNHIGISVAEYKVTNIREKCNCIFLTSILIQNLEEIEILDLASKIKVKIKYYFNLTKKA